MMSAHLLDLAPLLGGLLLLGCDPVPPRSQIVVVVDSDLLVPDELDTVTLELQRDGRPTQGPFVQLVDPAKRLAVPLPVTVTLAEREPSAERVSIVVRGVRRAEERVAHTVRAAFVEREIRTLCVRLDRDCVDVRCAPDETCDRGRCAPPEREEGDLPPYTDDEVERCRRGRAPAPLGDAGLVPDAGALDGSTEAGPEGGPEPLDGGAP